MFELTGEGEEQKDIFIYSRCWARKVRKYLYLKASLYNVTVRHEVINFYETYFVN
jgi:hypothetical protein